MTQGRLFAAKGLSRRCIRCGVDKPDADFAWRDKTRGRRFAHCRACQSKYSRKHYEQNRAKYIAKASARKRRLADENRARMLEFLAENQCVDCGESDLVVLEFDHLRDKTFEISQVLRDREWSVIIEKIAKCDVVCANCHRRRTSARQGSVRSILAREEQLTVERVKVIETS